MTDKPRRHWLRFSVRTLLGLITMLAILMAWVAKERRQSEYERQFGEQLLTTGHWRFAFGGPYDSIEHRLVGKPQGWFRNIAGQILGERIIVVDIDDPTFGSQELNIGGSRSLASLTNLRYLNFNSSQVSDITPLVGLKVLQHLYIESTQVSDLSPLVGLDSLQSMGLGQTPVNDLTPITGLKNLRQLSIMSTQVSDLAPLSELTKLRDLGAGSIHVSDLTPIAGLKNLRKLGLGDTPVNDLTPLRGLTNLEELYLNSTQVSDLSPLAGLTKLTVLDLRNSPVTKERIEGLQKALPNCKIEHDPFP